jgi:hypothetical protein
MTVGLEVIDAWAIWGVLLQFGHGPGAVDDTRRLVKVLLAGYLQFGHGPGAVGKQIFFREVVDLEDRAR